MYFTTRARKRAPEGRTPFWLARGQALVEFAIILPLLLLVIGGIVQFGMLFWAQNTLTQVARDTGRWAATQQGRPCEGFGDDLAEQADEIAQRSSLIGYVDDSWDASFQTYPATPRPADGIEATWEGPVGLLADDCPPIDNSTPWFVTIRANHTVDVFVPGMSFVCSGAGNTCSLSSTAQFRMEPAP
jgi:hypothetical protein